MQLFLRVVLAVIFIQYPAYSKDLSHNKPIIAASINPIYHIILAITQDKENTRLIINPNISQHDHHFRKSDVESVIESDLLFYISDDLEHKFAKLVKNHDKTAQSFQLINVKDIKILKKRSNVKQDDIHIWLNPENAIHMASFIATKLSHINPENAKEYHRNLRKFIKEVKISTVNIRSRLSQLENGFIFYHDGYQYFEDYFGVTPLTIVSYHHHSGIKVQEMKKISILAKQKRVKCMFGIPYDERNSAMKLAKNYDMKFAILDPIGLKQTAISPHTNGYASLLLKMADDMISCLN